MVTRYDFDKLGADDMAPTADGEYVKYEDYQKLEALVSAIAAIEWGLPPIPGMTEEQWRERAAKVLE